MVTSSRAASTLAALSFFVVMALVVGRTIARLEVPGHPEVPRYGMQDFRDSIYYPVRTLLADDNPYSPTAIRKRFAAGSIFPLYTPLHFVVHWPYGLMSQRMAEGVHLVFTMAFTLALAFACLVLCGLRPTMTTVFGLAAVLAASRPGYMNVFQGQTAAYLVLATYGALRWGRSRPCVAAACFAFTCLKPTFGLPLGILLMTTGAVRAAALGGAAALTVSALVGTHVVQLAGGWDAFAASLRENAAGWQNLEEARGATGILSVDTIALVDRVHDVSAVAEALLSAALLVLGVVAIARASRSGATSPLLVECIAVATMLTFTHHQHYDALLLALPFTALATGRLAIPGDRRGALRALVVALLAVAFFNHAASYEVLNGFDIRGSTRFLIVNATAAAITSTFLVLVWASLRMPRPGTRIRGA